MTTPISQDQRAMPPLSISKADNLPSHWQAAGFEKCLKKAKSTKRPSILREQYQTNGTYPIIDQGVEYIAGWTDIKEYVISEDLPVIIFGDHTRIFKYIDFPFAIGADGTKILRANSEILDPMYFYFALLNLDVPKKGYNRHYKYLRDFSIAFPTDKAEQCAIAQVLRAVQGAKEARQSEILLERERRASLVQYLFTHGTHGETRKQTQIGEIPESWQVMTLGEFIETKNGINFKGNQKGRGILTVDVSNMYSDSLYVQTNGLYRVDAQIKDEYLLKPNDILFVRSSLKQEGVGWPALFASCDEPVTFCGFLIRARLIMDTVQPKFLLNYLRLPSVRSLLVSKSGKVAITNINQASIRTLPIPIPSFSQQCDIAEALSRCDTKIAALEQELTLLSELFRAMLRELMTGRLSAVPLIDSGTNL